MSVLPKRTPTITPLIGFLVVSLAPTAHAHKVTISSDSQTFAGIGTVGHAWITFDPDSGQDRAIGFYPGSKGKGIYNGPGRFYEESLWRPWTYRFTYDLPADVYNAIVNSVNADLANPPKYQLFPVITPGSGTHCACWVNDKLEAGGLDTPGDHTHAGMSPANIAAVAQIYVGPFANINVNGPGGSTVECNPNFVPLQASPLNLGLCGHALTALAHDDPAGFELHTLFPVHTLNASTINGDTNDVFGIYADSNTTDELLSSSVDWGDGTSFTLTPSLDLEYTMEANHVYSHSFAQAGTYRVQCVFMLTDAVEIHEWDVVVTTASAGDPVSVLRRKLAIAPYPPAASTPWNPAASAPASVQIQ